MKNQFKKILTWFMVIAMMFTLMACSQNSKTGPDTSEKPTSPATDPNPSAPSSDVNPGKLSTLAKYDPPITVTTVFTVNPTVKFREGESIENNVWINAYREELGINLEYLWIANDYETWKQKMNAMMATGDLPDIIQIDDHVMFRQMMESGALADLTPYQSLKGPRLLEQEGKLGEYGETIQAEVTMDGKIYAWPHYGTGPLDSCPIMYIRQDWLDKNGWKVPTNMTELKDILYKFVNEDPDGNGQKDTFGLSVASGMFSGASGLEGFFNGFGAYPSIYYLDNGVVKAGDIDPGAKEALAVLAEFYADGVIDPEFMTNDYTELITKGQVGVSFGQMWNGIWPLNMTIENNPDALWISYPVVFEDGVKPGVSAVSGIMYYAAARKDFEHPEVIYKLVEFSLEKAYGSPESAEKFHWASDGLEVFKYALFRTVAFAPTQDSFRNVNLALQTGDPSKLNGEDLIYYNNCLAWEDGKIEGFGHWSTFGPKGSNGVLIDYEEKDMLVQHLTVGAPVQTSIDYGSSLADLRNQTFVKIITGELGIDAFDNYVEEWKTLGGDLILEEMQAKYGR